MSGCRGGVEMVHKLLRLLGLFWVLVLRGTITPKPYILPTEGGLHHRSKSFDLLGHSS